VIGRTRRNHAIRRSGARAGDKLYVSGRLGAAALGLNLMLRERERNNSVAGGKISHRRLLRPHLYPAIPVDLGIYLAERKLASAIIDLSDGLSTDLARLARASRVGARVYLDRLPAVAIPKALANAKIGREDLTLHGGEDYGLLFAVPARRSAEIPKRLRGVPITCIGEIVSGSGVRIVTSAGRTRRLEAAGWDPFRERR
jgi:thiamine-monophosphate kinase